MRAAVGLWVAATLVTGCVRIAGESCSVDVDCEQGKICREAMCRKPCLAPHWVGERVEVTTGQQVKQGQLAACEQRRYWVRYESGVEEQIDDSRFAKRSRK